MIRNNLGEVRVESFEEVVEFLKKNSSMCSPKQLRAITERAIKARSKVDHLFRCEEVRCSAMSWEYETNPATGLLLDIKISPLLRAVYIRFTWNVTVSRYISEKPYEISFTGEILRPGLNSLEEAHAELYKDAKMTLSRLEREAE